MLASIAGGLREKMQFILVQETGLEAVELRCRQVLKYT